MTHWDLVNFLGRRVVSIAFMLGGLVLALADAPALLPGGTILMDGAPSSDWVLRIIAVALPLLVAGLGFALFRAKPYYPVK